MAKPKAIDLTGERYGRLVVLERSGTYHYPDYGSQAIWRCRCDCGEVFETVGGYLLQGRTTSCGCYRRERMREINAKRRQRSEARLAKGGTT